VAERKSKGLAGGAGLARDAAKPGGKRPGMGRGLSAILNESATAPGSGDLREVPTEQVHPNPGQPRKRFDPEALAALTSSVAASGIVQPLLVRPVAPGEFELIAGERRLRAAREAGLERVPVIVRDPAEEERLQQALIENMVREDLNPVEEARACDALVRELGLSKQDVAKRIGRSRPALSNLIRLLELPDEALELMEKGELSEGHGRAILGVPDHDQRRKLARSAAGQGWSVRETERAAKSATEPKAPASSRRPSLSSEEREALEQAGERLERALGHEVRIRPRGEELIAELRLADLDAANQLADRISP